jgi:hypothetical protein
MTPQIDMTQVYEHWLTLSPEQRAAAEARCAERVKEVEERMNAAIVAHVKVEAAISLEVRAIEYEAAGEFGKANNCRDAIRFVEVTS